MSKPNTGHQMRAQAQRGRLSKLGPILFAGLAVAFVMPDAADAASGMRDMINPNLSTSSPAVQTDQLSPLAEGIAGQILDADGDPIEGTLISVRSLGPHGPPIPDIAVLSTQSGEYQWRLGPGRYLVSTSHADYLPMQRELLVHKGQVTIANFTLSR